MRAARTSTAASALRRERRRCRPAAAHRSAGRHTTKLASSRPLARAVAGRACAASSASDSTSLRQLAVAGTTPHRRLRRESRPSGSAAWHRLIHRSTCGQLSSPPMFRFVLGVTLALAALLAGGYVVVAAPAAATRRPIASRCRSSPAPRRATWPRPGSRPACGRRRGCCTNGFAGRATRAGSAPAAMKSARGVDADRSAREDGAGRAGDGDRAPDRRLDLPPGARRTGQGAGADGRPRRR